MCAHLDGVPGGGRKGLSRTFMLTCWNWQSNERDLPLEQPITREQATVHPRQCVRRKQASGDLAVSHIFARREGTLARHWCACRREATVLRKWVSGLVRGMQSAWVAVKAVEHEPRSGVATVKLLGAWYASGQGGWPLESGTVEWLLLPNFHGGARSARCLQQ